MANSKLLTWQGGARESASGSTKFILKQSREPYGSSPKTQSEFQDWLVRNDYISRLSNNTIDSAILYQQLTTQFYSACGGGDGGLMFGVQVVRKDRTALPEASSVALKTTWGRFIWPTRYAQSKTVPNSETIFVDVSNSDKVVISDYYITQGSPAQVKVNPSGTVEGGFYIDSYRWMEGGAYNSYGERVTNRADIGFTEREIDPITGTMTLKFPQKLIGTLSLYIEHEFDSYELLIYPHEFPIGSNDIYDEQKVYDTTILGFGGGDYVNMPLDIPESAADCIPYAQILDIETGQYITVIEGSDTHHAYDFDGDGEIDNGAEVDACVCWMCGGTGVLPDCEESAVIDCTCPNCQGTGILPACQEDEDGDTNNTYYYYQNNAPDDDDDDETDKPYTLKVTRHKCTNQVSSWDLIKN